MDSNCVENIILSTFVGHCQRRGKAAPSSPFVRPADEETGKSFWRAVRDLFGSLWLVGHCCARDGALSGPCQNRVLSVYSAWSVGKGFSSLCSFVLLPQSHRLPAPPPPTLRP
jgi:hypothetical protein